MTSATLPSRIRRHRSKVSLRTQQWQARVAEAAQAFVGLVSEPAAVRMPMKLWEPFAKLCDALNAKPVARRRR